VLVGVQWLSISVGPLTRLLGTVPLRAGDWAVLAAAVLWPVVVVEVIKGRGADRLLWRSRPRVTGDGPPPAHEMHRNH
jgi:hypothetical protein